MNAAERIIAKFGGIRPMARIVGLAPNSVQNWKRTGLIPASRQQGLLELARREGIELEPADFFEAAA